MGDSQMTEEEIAAEPAHSVVGVRFKDAGRVFYFDPGDFQLSVGDLVVVSTPQGSEIGRVVIAPDQVLAAEIDEPLERVLRVSEPEDLAKAESLRQRIREDIETARKKVAEHDLPMHLIEGDYNLEGSQLTLYFMAEQRVDFRNLVRDLSSSIGKRVQLLQIGERDRAKLSGGIGHCGLLLCCRTWLTSFPSISIRMAKEQDVPLNPAKISGVCGRLLCCLAYEHDQYRELRGQLPKIGQVVSTPGGSAKLIGINMPREMVTLFMIDAQTIVEMPAAELRKQYGSVVRPSEMEKELTDAAVSGTAGAEAEATTPAENADAAAADSTARPRKRRRRRNGRRKHKPGTGQDSA